MGEIHSILDNLLSNVLWIPIGAFLAYVWFFLQVRLPNRRLWRYKDSSCLTVCAATSTMTNTGVYTRPATGVGQLRALAVATRSLYRAYRKNLDIQNILLSKDPLQERIENDLLLLGGPKNNGISAKFLELLGDEQPVRVIDNLIIWRVHRVASRWVDQDALEFEGHTVNRKVIVDYGLIVRSYNPFTNRERTAILFAGSHTYGTVVAAKFFTEDLHKELGKLTQAGRKNFTVLVSSQIIDGHPTKMKVERSYAW